MAKDDKDVDGLIRELLSEINDLAPKESTLTTTSAGDSSEPIRDLRPDRRKWLALVAVFALAIAGASLWALSRDSTPLETTAPASEDVVPPAAGDTEGAAVAAELSAYRWTVEDLSGSGLQAEGVVDVENSRASISIEPIGIEALAEDDTVTPEGLFGTTDFTLFFADRTRTMTLIEETFTVGAWEDLGSATVNGLDTTRFQAPVSADFGEEIFITDSVIGFFELFSPWEGTIEVFVRENGLVAQLNLAITEQDGGFDSSLQLNYFDVDEPVEFD